MNDRIVNSAEMRAVDKYAINQTAIPAIVLMEQAAYKCFEIIKDIYLKYPEKKIIAICGNGNNGGDGFAICRHLVFSDIIPEIIFVGAETKLSESARTNYNIIKNLGIKINQYPVFNPAHEYFNNSIIIDALFGTGINGIFNNKIIELIEKINNSAAYVIAVDTPSGLADNTENIPVKANLTLSIGALKSAFFNEPGIYYTGQLKLIELNFPAAAFKKECSNLFANTIRKTDLLNLLSALNSCKTHSGKVTIIAGSYKYSGAAILATRAAVKAGGGLVYALVPETIADFIKAAIPEAIVIPLDSATDGSLDSTKKNKSLIDEYMELSDSLLIGPGLTVSAKTKDICEYTIKKAVNTVIIDADALNNIADNRQLLTKNKKAQFILTPHPGELSRWINLNIPAIQKNRNEAIEKINIAENIILILKGRYTVIADNQIKYINMSGNSLLAVAGTGDVLSGIICAITAKFKMLNLTDAARISVFLHGAAADYLKNRQFRLTLQAMDIIDNFDITISELLKANEEYFQSPF